MSGSITGYINPSSSSVIVIAPTGHILQHPPHPQHFDGSLQRSGISARFDILPCFDAVLGLDHIYATSKEGIGRAWMEESAVDPADCVMIGDTLHDAQVARALGWRCILVCGGHQLRATLETAGTDVAQDLFEAARVALGGA